MGTNRKKPKEYPSNIQLLKKNNNEIRRSEEEKKEERNRDSDDEEDMNIDTRLNTNVLPRGFGREFQSTSDRRQQRSFVDSEKYERIEF